MPTSNVELSKDAVKISYLRLLSDSTAGLLVILFGFIIYYYPVYSVTLQQLYKPALSTEVKVFLIVTFVLISSPLGLTVNALSWVCLGSLQVYLQKYWFNRTWLDFLVKSAKGEFQFEKYKRFFRLDSKEDWYHRSQLIKQSLAIYHSQIPDAFEHVRGVRTLFRNFSWLSLLFTISMLIKAALLVGDIATTLVAAVIAFAASALAMITTSILGFYYNSQIYIKCYILCLEAGVQSDFQARDEEIIGVLSRSANMRHGNELHDYPPARPPSSAR